MGMIPQGFGEITIAKDPSRQGMRFRPICTSPTGVAGAPGEFWGGRGGVAGQAHHRYHQRWWVFLAMPRKMAGGGRKLGGGWGGSRTAPRRQRDDQL